MATLKTADEIRAAVDRGQTVYSDTHSYVVTKGSGQMAEHYFIRCLSNGYVTGLTWRDGQTLNGTLFFTDD